MGNYRQIVQLRLHHRQHILSLIAIKKSCGAIFIRSREFADFDFADIEFADIAM